MHKFVRSLLTEWRRLALPVSGETIIVAVSGGADSVSLLLALADLSKRGKIDNNFVVAHFDHRLRGESGREESGFVGMLADRFGFGFESGEAVGDLAIGPNGNVEQNARRSRYAFLASVVQKFSAFAVLTAHTIDDQAETFLMNLLRGSGPTGLRAMRTVNDGFVCDEDAQRMTLVRPMIGWASREETEDYCRHSAVDFRVDPMNSDLRFTRVRIREELIPLLKTYNPAIVGVLARTAAMMPAESDEPKATELKLSALEPLDEITKSALLRAWIKSERGGLRGVGSKHIDAIVRLISSRKSGRTVELPGGGMVVKGGGKLRFRAGTVE